MSERCQREWVSGEGGEETPLLAAVEAIGLPEGATRVAFIGTDGYRREVALAALRNDSTAILVTNPDGTRRVVFPNRPLSFWIKNLDRIETR
jgi:hypothetical protein